MQRAPFLKKKRKYTHTNVYFVLCHVNKENKYVKLTNNTPKYGYPSVCHEDIRGKDMYSSTFFNLNSGFR
jgi:hypothetical protein